MGFSLLLKLFKDENWCQIAKQIKLSVWETWQEELFGRLNKIFLVSEFQVENERMKRKCKRLAEE